MARDLGLTLKNLFFPNFCQVCDRRLLTEENGYFCPTCWELSPRIQRPFCTICGKPHAGVLGFGSPSNFPCAPCRSRDPKRRPIRRIYGAAYFEGAVEQAVKLLKFEDKPRLARPLAALMGEFAVQEMETGAYDYIVPVPLHRVRQRHRGFNQSFLLAEALVPIFAGASLDTSLERIRPTKVQSRLKTAAERQANVRGAFAVADGRHLKGKTVLLIDDVVTTSDTVSECARALRRAGAAYIDVLAAALAVQTATVEEPNAPVA